MREYPYTLQPVISPLNRKSDKLLFRLRSIFTTHFMLQGQLYKLVIFPGFIFDGSSKPRWSWSLLGKTPVGFFLASSCVHDFLYMMILLANKRKYLSYKSCAHKLYAVIGGKEVPAEITYTRKEADKIMMQVCKNSSGKNNISSLQKKLIYLGVRIGGQKHWKTSTPLHVLNPTKCKKDGSYAH